MKLDENKALARTFIRGFSQPLTKTLQVNCLNVVLLYLVNTVEPYIDKRIDKINTQHFFTVVFITLLYSSMTTGCL